jgi:hypothetical protein
MIWSECQERVVVYGALGYGGYPAAQDMTVGLAALPPDRLRAVMLARGIDPGIYRRQSAANAAAIVAGRLALAQSVVAALAALSARELATLQALWQLGPTLERSRIARLFAEVLSGADLAATLNRLETLALLLPTDDSDTTLFVPAAVRGVLAGNNSTPRPAAALFHGTSSATLGRIAEELDIEPVPKRKEDRLAAVVEALQQREVVQRQLAALSEQEREIFAFVVRRGGLAEPNRITQRFPYAAGPRPPYTYGYGDDVFLRGEGRGDLAPMLRLQARGLLVPYPSGYPSQLAIPDEVLAAQFPTYELNPADFVEPPFVAPPPGAQPAGAIASPVLDLLDALQYASEVNLTLTKSQRLPKPPRAKLAKLLPVADPSYADFLLAVAIAGDILRAKPDGKLNERAKDLDALLALDDRDSRAAMLEFWLALTTWYDPGDDPYLRVDSGTAIGTSPSERGIVLRLLTALPQDGATLPSIVARLRYSQPRYFAVDDGGLAPYVYGEPPTPLGLLLGVLRVFAWLGLAEPLTLAARPGESAAVVGLRLTELGRDILATELQTRPYRTVVPVPRTDRIVLQPTLEILAPPNIQPRVYRDLRRFADLSSAAGMRTLVLTAASLRRGIDLGAQPDSIRALLEKHGGPLPSTVTSLIDEAAARYGRISVGDAAVYVTADDEHLLAELIADRRLADLDLQQVSPTVAVVAAGSAAIVIAKLRAAGHAPVAAGERPRRDPFASAPKSHHANPAGAKTRVVEEIDEKIEATLLAAYKRDEMVDVTYHRRGNSGQKYAKHRLTIIDLDLVDKHEVYGRCWLCNTSVRLSTSRITEATLTGEENPDLDGW